MRRISKRAAAVGVTTGFVAGGLGIAVATSVGGLWTASTNTGTGYGKAIQMSVSTSTVADDADGSVKNHATSGLYPGASGQPLFVRVANPNPFSVDVTSIATTNDSTVTSSSPTDCPASNVLAAVSTQPLTSDNTIAAGDSKVFELPSALSMAGTAPNACQSVVFSVDHVSVAATQTATGS